jgi:hypothetical protein
MGGQELVIIIIIAGLVAFTVFVIKSFVKGVGEGASKNDNESE